jgi:translation initiation factor IF-2
VVIDSQAARRGPGGPGGPGGGPNQPPRRQRRGRRRRGVYNDTIAPLDVEAQSGIDTVRVASGSNVKQVSESLGVPVPDVIKKLMMLGQMATLTQTLSDDAIQIIADEFDRTVDITSVGDEDAEAPAFEDDPADLVHRPPVVTIMGHVDHGKTSLLDAIREADVVGGEAGGITQHIGAYQVHRGENVVTFLDTPGHEAFTAMRARGAKVTDIAIIVVAADDGVKPQTREAVDHALAAEVPVLVAVNKVDKEGADPTRVRTEMTTLGLQPVEWGGDIEFVDVSAKARTGLDTLLETIQLVAELEDLKANPDAEASGIVIESKLDPGRGPVVTMLVQRGTLKIGNAVVAGPEWGKVRALTDYHGTRTKTAIPGDPIEILGFDGVPDAGEHVRVVKNDREARREANDREIRLKSEALARRSGRKVSLEDVFKRQQGSSLKELPIIVKADVAGSVEAIEDEIAKLPQSEVFVDVISSGVGGITESDVMLASASEAIILGFNVRPVGDARGMAEREGIEIRHYSVIYKALDDLRDAMEGMLDPEEIEDTVGQVEVRAIFRASKIGVIAGSYVLEGKITRGGRVRIVRDGTVVADTTVAGLKRFNDDAREVAAGFECGITLTNYQDIKQGDVLETYETRKVDRELA